MTTIRRPSHSGRRPSSIAAWSAAPHEIPQRTPSAREEGHEVSVEGRLVTIARART